MLVQPAKSTCKSILDARAFLLRETCYGMRRSICIQEDVRQTLPRQKSLWSFYIDGIAADIIAFQRQRYGRTSEQLWSRMEVVETGGSQSRAIIGTIGNPYRGSKFL